MNNGVEHGETGMGAVVIGMDPHRRSATIEVMDRDETILGGGRYATDVAGYRAMLAYGSCFRSGRVQSRAAPASAARRVARR